MTHKHIFKIIGDGDCRQGKALDEEVYEAEAEGDMEQYRYELVDVMATIVRAYNREWVKVV